jgi:parallel beta-helix repeat protein
MRARRTFAAAHLAIALGAAVPVTDDLLIRTDTVLKPGVYRVNDVRADGVIQILADGVTLDGTGVVIEGRGFRGYGIRMNGHTGLTLRNFTLRGFDYGIVIQDASSVLLENNDVSGNRKDETTGFLDIGCPGCYGGGILLLDVRASTVRRNVLTNQSTGLEIIGGGGNKVYANTLSQGPAGNEARQNSAWGIRLEGTTGNLVRGNLADYVDRERYGLSSGDSAGILLVSGAHGNRIVSNSLRHSGDGFFLGNSCARASHRNYVYGNDGSFSPHNAFEATFSSGNVFVNNQASDSDYGFWLGYSYDSRVSRNEIGRNRSSGIAIEHGHGNEIDRNRIAANSDGIRLWAADDTCLFPDCGTSCPSAGYRIHHNTVTGNADGLSIENTTGAVVSFSRIAGNESMNVLVLGHSTVSLLQNDLSCTGDCSLAVADFTLPAEEVSAAQNFWGTVDPAAIAQQIFDREDSPDRGKVTFEPFLTAPPRVPTPVLGCPGGELLEAPLAAGLRGARSTLSYEGLATLDVTGTGQASGRTRSDAFYLYAKADGTPMAPIHPRNGLVLAINNRPIEAWLVDGIPPYRPDHHYVFRIRAPRGALVFGVADATPADNTGAYRISLCGGGT